jgi:uncharacterized protein
MNPDWLYYLWATLLLVGNTTAWATNLFNIPGNWIVLGLTGLFAFLLPQEDGRGVGMTTLLVLLGLAVLGELIEFAAGAAGAAKKGGSRRGMALAIVGAFFGSILGAVLSLPVPIAGPILGAVGGGALGAFLGAYVGETWKGRTSRESYEISQAALVGRLLGTIGKLTVGAVMVVVAAIGSFL